MDELIHASKNIYRWMDSGDIYSLPFLKMMARIANAFPHLIFYSYTKSISIVIKFGWENLPKNLKLIQSYGGIEDHLIDRSKPFAQVFKSEKDIPKNFTNCSDSDIPAATFAKRIGIVAHGARKNNFMG